jgi:hypothetical protein
VRPCASTITRPTFAFCALATIALAVVPVLLEDEDEDEDEGEDERQGQERQEPHVTKDAMGSEKFPSGPRS